MANKDLTAEELIAKKIRRSNGWTRFWAIVLALVLVGGVAGVANNKAKKANAIADENASKYAQAMVDAQAAANQGGAQSGWSDGAGNGSATPAGPASDEAKEAADAINAATAAGEKAGYDWARNCKYTEAVNVGNATDVLNKVIKGVDKNASIDSVVGGFIGVGDNKVTKPADKTFKQVYDYHGENYGLKATSLKPEDIQDLTVDGDTYTFKLADAKTPKKDGSTPFSRLTNDIVIQEEVSKEITDLVGGAVKVENLDVVYSNITVKAVITDGKLQELTYSYDGRVNELALKVAVVNVKGTGAIHTDATYSNFVY